MDRTRSVNVGATIAIGLLAAMCGERPGAKVRIRPLEKAAAGKTSGTAGSSSGAGGTANGSIGAGGDQGAGEGGGTATQTPNDDGTMNRGGNSSRGGGGGRMSTGGSGDTGATDASGGTAGDDATGATGGNDDGATAGDTGEPGTGGTATGGSAGQAVGGSAGLGGSGGSGASAGGGAGGSGGATTSCELKTGCCAADDPPCIDGCPSNADFCCNVGLGARTQCDPSASYTAVVCLDCDGQSFGTQACSTACLVATDPPCSDATWDDLCSTGGYAYCSDPTAGYRAGCYADEGGSGFYSYITCTCDPDS